MASPSQVGNDDVELEELYAAFSAAHMAPLWTHRDDLMTDRPRSAAVPAHWQWSTLLPLAERAGALVPVGRGGERRAIALANPGFGGRPYCTTTLWAAIQYLGPRETAPAHRHSQTAFRFVVDGQGVWTNVDGDAVAMRRGDLLLTPGWHFHEHHNTSAQPTAWIDGLDIPLVEGLDAGFFEFGSTELSTTATPDRSVNERLWAHPGLRPLSSPAHRGSPLLAYRWEHTDAALCEQLALADEGVADTTTGPGHAAVRFVSPANGRDALSTIRTEMHRLRPGTISAETRCVGSSVWQVFDGQGSVSIGDRVFSVAVGDLVAVPSWQPMQWTAGTELTLFKFGDEPVYEALGLFRAETTGQR